MKNFTVLHILLFLLLMLVYQCAKAQDYVVTLKGDTINGKVKIHAYGPEKKVQVTTVDEKKSAYSILQIRSFNLKGEKYVPVRVTSGYVFMKLIKEGYLSLYTFQLPNQVTYDGQYLLKKDGHGMEVPNLAFKKIITRYLEDCAAVTAKIESGELGKNSIEKIVDTYNGCIAGRTNNQPEAIVQKTQPPKKLNAWDALEEKVKGSPDFEGKSDALEMITEVKSKIEKGEKIPNFLIEGLKSNLSNTALSEDLDNAMKEMGN